MLVRHKKPFLAGIGLLSSFLLLFWLMLSPIITGANGNRLTGLEYADEVFNQLSKGSSYFIPAAQKNSQTLLNFDTSLSVKFKSPELETVAQMLLRKAGIDDVSAQNGKLAFAGSLGKILLAACTDSDLLYKNDGTAIEAKYNGEAPATVARAWWQMLDPCIAELQKQGHINEAKIVDQVVRRAIEPGNNFYGIKAESVADNILLLCAFMLFYVLYTVWYGFAIYEIFDGFGLMAASDKKEA